MLVLDVTNAYIVIMDTQTVSHVAVQNGEVQHLFVMHQENALVCLVLLEEHVNNVVQDTINILNANSVIVIAKDRLEYHVIMMVNANVNLILPELDVINVRKVYTIFQYVKNVIVILLVFYQLLLDVDHCHWVSYVNVSLESLVEYAMNAENFIGTYNPRIRTVVKNVIVSCLGYLVV